MTRLMKTQRRLNVFSKFAIIFITIFFLVITFMPGSLLAGAKGNTQEIGCSPKKTLETGDPISAGGGEFRQYRPLFALGGLMPVDFTLIYAPDLQVKSPLNEGRTQFPNWCFIDSFTSNTIKRIVEFEDRTVVPAQAYINVFVSDDTLVFKDDSTGNFVPVGPEKYRIKNAGDYYYLMDPLREWVYIFRSRELVGWESPDWAYNRAGEIVHIMDRNNNTLSYTYNDDNLPTQIKDGLGRRLELEYIADSNKSKRHLIGVSDGYGRTVIFNYQELTCNGWPRDVLVSLTDKMNQTTTFDYYDTANTNCNLIKKINLPSGNSHIDQSWTQNPKGVDAIDSQKDAYGNETTLSFSQHADSNIITTVDHPDTSQRVFHHERERYPLDVTDPSGNQFTIGYNSEDQMTSITDRLGDTTSFTYHTESGKIASITNARGDMLRFTYAGREQTFTNPGTSDTVDFTFYDLTRVDYPDGTNEQFTYDSRGNPVSRMDQAGSTWSYTYNGKGQVLTITNPTSGVTTYTYNTDATLATSTDSDTVTTFYAYDKYKRLNKITRPDGKSIQIAYNLKDLITSVTDENNNTYSYTYNANGNQTKTTDPAGNETQYAYDLMDRVSQVTDRLGKAWSFSYDSMGRDGSATDPNEIQTTYGYDSRGWPTGVTTGGGTWQTAYDNEGVVSSRKTPMGNTTSYQTDSLGRTTGMTNPLNQTTAITRDTMGRIKDITDPLNRTTQYTYDGLGLLSGVTVPVIGSAGYTRNGLGLVSKVTDTNGQKWAFGYTGMGRMQSSTDPLGNIWQHTYDNRGRLNQTTYPDTTTTLTRTYDDAGNITRRLYSDGPDIQYTYDELDRLMTADGLTLTRDKEGRITDTENPGMHFGATYDNGGRLKTVTYNNEAFTVTYTYDAATGLLSSVTDSLTACRVDFTYDSDRRSVGINRSNNVNRTLSWDNASRLTRIQDGGIIDIQYTLDAAGQVTQAIMAVPLDPAALLSMGTEGFTHDPAFQISGSGYSHDQQGRLTAAPGHTYAWDAASRLTGIDSATLTYNGLGDLVTRAEGGTTTHYYYNYAIGLTPIVAEQDEAGGQFPRYYVWSPGGSLLYMIDAANGNKVHFYHFDHTGSTLALTDASGAVTDSYAYDPYGRLLQHNP